MQIETMQELYVDILKDLYDAEQQILKALPKMAKAANSEELRDGFQEHLAQTQTHLERLDQVFAQIGETAKRKKCKAMEELLTRGRKGTDGVGFRPRGAQCEMIAASTKSGTLRNRHLRLCSHLCGIARPRGRNRPATADP